MQLEDGLKMRSDMKSNKKKENYIGMDAGHSSFREWRETPSVSRPGTKLNKVAPPTRDWQTTDEQMRNPSSKLE